MKTYQPSQFARSIRVAGAVAVLMAAGSAVAQNNQNQKSSSNRDTANRQMHADATKVKVTRATTYLGTDVTASDGRKVGDIADYVFDTSASPHLKYVIVVTDGFLGFGGDARAVPAGAISTEGDSARLKIDSEQYWNAAVIPQDRVRFLNNRQNTDQLARDFNLGDRSGAQNTQNRANQNNRSQNENSPLVTFSELQNSEIYGSDGERLGRFVDTWLSLDHNRAPYMEISSPPQFEVLPRTRVAIPFNQLQPNTDDSWSYRVSATSADLEKAEAVSETDGVKMLQSGEIGKTILRVRVAAR